MLKLLALEHNYSFGARDAIETGIRNGIISVEAPSGVVPSGQLLSIYQFRAKHLARLSDPREVGLVKDVNTLCNALENTLDQDIEIWIATDVGPKMQILFIGAQSGSIHGYFSMDDRRMTDEEWKTSWGKRSEINECHE